MVSMPRPFDWKLRRIRLTAGVNSGESSGLQPEECCCAGEVQRWCLGGQGRGRTADLSLFRRALVPTELPGRDRSGERSAAEIEKPAACDGRFNYSSDPDRTRTGGLRRDRAAL